MQFDEFRSWFDSAFLDFVDRRVDSYQRFTSREAIVLGLSQVRKLAKHGKRIRPYLAYLSYEAEGGRDMEDIKEALLAIELFHVFCLIHDDIIDEDDLRRGVTTINALSRTHYEKTGRPGLAVRAGNAQALLVGDLVYSWVFECMSKYQSYPGLVSELMYTIDEVVIGQMIDVDLMAHEHASRDVILEKMRLKTAGYTFVQPLRMGRLLAGGERNNEHVDALGLSLGLAFQMQDDLLDVYGKEADLGKDIGSDIAESQHTLLTQYVMDHGQPDDTRKLRVLVGQAVDEDRLQLLRHLFERTGAAAALRSDIQEHIRSAYEFAQKLAWPDTQKEALAALVAYVEKRNT